MDANKSVPRYTHLVLHDLIGQPGFNPATQNNRGDWSLRDVSSGDVYAGEDGKPECVEHGAMNAVTPDRSLWRCLNCGRAAYVTEPEPQYGPNPALRIRGYNDQWEPVFDYVSNEVES